MTERTLQTIVLKYLSNHPNVVRAWAQDSDSIKARKFTKTNNKKGVSDIIGLLDNGKLLAIELKQGKNRPSVHQLEFIEQCERAGAIAFFAWSLDEVKLHLTAQLRKLL